MSKQEKKKKEAEPLVEIFRHTLVNCDRCAKPFESELLVNIAFSHPYGYSICGRCNSMPRAKKRQIINQIIQRIQDDNGNA